ncbi:HupE/UreJ family protein [Polynucleobacter paneuropaeus]|jgi:urease accessory protein|uniref:HupE/UreJ family protein n=1 Tax=Polynucleobacter paneuropaeus TaxID=2527775 RepID=UPI001BFD9127|nr:HupE/UreJ family protein [Polynucleobacter paneuropaeus]MBT8622794.1 HupE/UreJ family protein [Polynucleobacter paneuropaeus]
MKIIKLMLFVFSIVFSQISNAHPGHVDYPSFMSGLMHPFSGIDHLLVIFLVGFWSVCCLRKIWVGPLAFMLGMVLGVLLGLASVSITWLEWAISISVVLAGAFTILRKKMDSHLGLYILTIFGIFHGLAHGEVLSIMPMNFLSASVQDLAGLLLATSMLHLLGMGVAKVGNASLPMISKSTGAISLTYGLFLIFKLIE